MNTTSETHGRIISRQDHQNDYQPVSADLFPHTVFKNFIRGMLFRPSTGIYLHDHVSQYEPICLSCEKHDGSSTSKINFALPYRVLQRSEDTGMGRKACIASTFAICRRSSQKRRNIFIRTVRVVWKLNSSLSLVCASPRRQHGCRTVEC